MRNNRMGFWTNEKVKMLFNAYCKIASRPSVNWKKFRSTDKKGIFSRYNDAYLSLMFLKEYRRGMGICIYCGKEKAIADKDCCKKCDIKINRKKKS
jgi:hypothetical protein